MDDLLTVHTVKNRRNIPIMTNTIRAAKISAVFWAVKSSRKYQYDDCKPYSKSHCVVLKRKEMHMISHKTSVSMHSQR